MSMVPWLLMAHLLLVVANAARKGAESLDVVLWQVIPALGALLALLIAHRSPTRKVSLQTFQPRLGGVLLISGILFTIFGNLIYGTDPWQLLPWRLLCVPLLACYLLPAMPEPGSRLTFLYGPARRGIFVAIVGLAVGLRVAGLKMSPSPLIDVWWFTNQGALGILKGINPYDRSYHVIDPRSETLYAYLPGQFLFDLPAARFLGDMRWGQVLLELVTAWLLYQIVTFKPRVTGPARASIVTDGTSMSHFVTADAAEMPENETWSARRLAGETVALLLLFFPQSLCSQEQAWVEFKQVFAIALIAWLSQRRPALTYFAVGLLFSLKQTTWPAAAFLGQIGGFSRQAIHRIAAVMMVLIVPFIYWNPLAFYQDIVAYHVGLPLPHSPSISWTWQLLTGHGLPLSALAVTGILVLVWLWYSGHPGMTSFLIASATLSLVPVLMRQAYINYYYYVDGIVLAALAMGLWEATRNRVTPRQTAPTWPAPAPMSGIQVGERS